MSNSAQQAALQPLLRELKPHARKVALRICRVYQDRHERRALTEMRKEFDNSKRKMERATRAMKKFNKELARLVSAIKSKLKGDLRSWSDVVREAHIPPRAPVLLYLPGDKWDPREYFRKMRLPDPAGPLEAFVQTYAALRRFTSREVSFLQHRVRQMSRPQRTRLGLFSTGGGIQYALLRLFKDQASGRLSSRHIEEQIARILNQLDRGGPSIDPERGGCAGVRKAIERLPQSHKDRCDKHLSYWLDHFRT